MGESINAFKGLSFAYVFHGCINTLRSSGSVLTDNVMAGCAQGGLVTRGLPCDETYTWSGNEIHSAQHAIHLTGRNLDEIGCVNIKNVYAWRNFDYGLMVHAADNVKAENLVMVECGVGMMVHGVG